MINKKTISALQKIYKFLYIDINVIIKIIIHYYI